MVYIIEINNNYLATMEKRMNKFELSPDGKFIAFLGKYGQIYLLSSKVI